MNVLVVFGTRPEAVKVAPVVWELRRRAAEGAPVRVWLCSTGQHREMLRPLFDFFDLHPDADLDLMEPNQTLASLTARIVRALDGVLGGGYLGQDAQATGNLGRDVQATGSFQSGSKSSEPLSPIPRPDLVLVQGDTTTAMCAALAAYYREIPVGHIEAGLRTNTIRAPFPEEVNRRIISQIAALNFAPTAGARENLERQGLCREQRVWVTGNTVIDALLRTADRTRAHPPSHPLLDAVSAWRAAHPAARLILVTGHRRENYGPPFESFCRGLLELARVWPDDLLVYPVHLNPNVRRPVRKILAGAPNIRLEDPLDYPVFVSMMDRAHLIITDSGGIQEEAPSLGKPVLVTRDVTERPEAVRAGAVRIVGPHAEAIVAEAGRLLGDADAYARMAAAVNPYGDGRAAERIADAIEGKPVTEFAEMG